LSRRVLHWVRRLHLYSGLFMLPWVLLYAVSAFLFNHPDAFPDQPTRSFGPKEVRGTPLEGIHQPTAAAEEVVAALQAQGNSCRLVRPEEAAFSRSRVTVTARAPGIEHAVVVDLTDGTGLVRTKSTESPEPAPFARKAGVRTESPLPDRLREGTLAVLQRMGLSAEEATISGNFPELTFAMEADGQVWTVTYHPQQGAVNGRLANSPGDGLSTRRFLTQLHLSRGYPANGGARWFWAVAVDAMFMAMVFWGVSGLLMWSQIKAVRRWGGVVLTTSAVVATLMAVGMHRALAP
jgi:hypothetical protein